MRARKSDPPVRIQCYIPQSLFLELNLLLPQDPLTNRPSWGAMSTLMEGLITTWVREQAITLSTPTTPEQP